MVASIAPQHTTPGISPSFQSALAGGDTYLNSGSQILQLKNTGPVSVAVTIAARQPCSQQFLHPLTFTIPAGLAVPFQLGPIGTGNYNDPTTSNVSVAYSTSVQAPPGAPVASLLAQLGLGIGAYRYAVTFVNGSGETTGGTEILITTTSGSQAVSLQGIPLGPGGTTARKLYRTPVNGASGAEQLLTTIADNVTTTYIDTVPDSSLGAAVPALNTAGVPAPGAAAAAAGAGGNPNGTYRGAVTFLNAGGETTGGVEIIFTVVNQQISWSSIPIGPTGTTARRLYRTALLATGDTATFTESATVNSTTKADSDTPATVVTSGQVGTEKLVTTINDNTTTTFSDNVSDGALGAAIPTTNGATCVQVAVTQP